MFFHQPGFATINSDSSMGKPCWVYVTAAYDSLPYLDSDFRVEHQWPHVLQRHLTSLRHNGSVLLHNGTSTETNIQIPDTKAKWYDQRA